MKLPPSYLVILLGVFFFFLAPAAWAQTELIVPLRSQDLPAEMTLGSIQVEGLGSVELVAKRTGTRVIIHALGKAGEVIGKADTFIGLTSTPIYIQGQSGLHKIDILWHGEEKGGRQ